MEILRIATFLLLQPLSLCLKKKKEHFLHFLAIMTGLRGGCPSLWLVLLLMSYMWVTHPRCCPRLVSAGKCPVRWKPWWVTCVYSTQGGVPGWSPQGTAQSEWWVWCRLWGSLWSQHLASNSAHSCNSSRHWGPSFPPGKTIVGGRLAPCCQSLETWQQASVCPSGPQILYGL